MMNMNYLCDLYPANKKDRIYSPFYFVFEFLII